MHPVFRSPISAIQVMGIARTQDIKNFGCEALLGSFINDMEKLASVSIHKIYHNKVPCTHIRDLAVQFY